MGTSNPESLNILLALVSRNLRGQYKNSYFGFMWQFLTPFATIVLFYLLFTSLRTNNIENYWAYLCVGMFPFAFLRESIVNGSNAIIHNASMVKKIYFPRWILVASFVISNAVTFAISYVICIALFLLTSIPLTINIVTVVPLFLLTMIFSYGVTLFLSSIVVYVRDLGYFINATSRVLFWVTPVFYMASSLTGMFSKIIWLNPLTYYVTCFQDVIYFGTFPSATILLQCISFSIVALFVGWITFNKLQKRFAECL